MNMKTEADGYRLNNKKMDGFVVFTKEGILSGWCKTLDDASSWKPGVRAIGINGDEYISWGGDDQNGAEGWKQVMKSRGRPKKDDAMSNAEKQKAYRDRQRELKENWTNNKRSNVTKKAESNDVAFDALANKLAMTERGLLSSQGEVKRLYDEIAELQREVVKLSKKPKKGYL